MRKTYVLDTNVLIYDPRAILKFEDNDVVLPIYVIEEVDQFKRETTERGRNAREVARVLDDLRTKRLIVAGSSGRRRHRSSVCAGEASPSRARIESTIRR